MYSNVIKCDCGEPIDLDNSDWCYVCDKSIFAEPKNNKIEKKHMKAILKFDLSSPDDQIDFDRVTKALNMAVAIWEYDQYLRSEYKHGENEHAYAFRQKFREFLTDNDIDIDRLLR